MYHIEMLYLNNKTLSQRERGLETFADAKEFYKFDLYFVGEANSGIPSPFGRGLG